MCFRPAQISMKICPKCRAQNKPVEKVCTKCGAELEDMMLGDANAARAAPKASAAYQAPSAPKAPQPPKAQ